jgi:hypothetical protein
LPGQALDVFEGHALFQEVGDGGDAEGVRREAHGQGSVLEPALDHAADVDHRQGVFGELAGLAKGGAEEGSGPSPAPVKARASN